MLENRRADFTARYNNRAVGRSSPYLGAIGRKPRHMLSLQHSGIRKELAREQDTLSAEARYHDILIHADPPFPFRKR